MWGSGAFKSDAACTSCWALCASGLKVRECVGIVCLKCWRARGARKPKRGNLVRGGPGNSQRSSPDSPPRTDL